MPAGLRKFVLSKEFDNADMTLQKTYNLSSEQTTKMGDEIMSAIYNDEDLSTAVENIKQVVVPSPVDNTNWKDFLADMLKLEIWPLRELFGQELTTVLGSGQISTAGWPPFRVLLRPLTYSGAATEVAQAAKFSLMGAHLRKRLRDLIMSRVKGVRVDAQVRDSLIRPVEFGGVGMDRQTADTAIVEMNQLISQVKIMSEDQYADWLAEDTQKKTEAEKSTSTEPETSEDKEIAEIRAKMPSAPSIQSVLDASVEKTLTEFPYKPTDPYLARRLQHVIASRFRDVRSSFDVQRLLCRDPKVGGMGLDKPMADQISAKIEEAYKTFHDPIMAEEKQKLEKQAEIQHQKIEERKERESEEHAQWYQERILARKKKEKQKKKLVETMRETMSAYAAGPTTPIAVPTDIKEQKKETARFGHMVQAVNAGAKSVTPATEQTVPVIPSAAAVLTAGRVARPEIKVSMETVKLQKAQSDIKPHMDGVVSATTAKRGPRLVGLVEELRSLTPAKFRRLGKDPEASTQKILQKIDIMGQESFKKRLSGIQAWQASPLQEAYVRLVSESFKQGKPIVDLANEKRAAGEDVLRPEEVNAIISLNSKLHY